MPSLIFKYGPMNSSKTANLLMKAYNYRSQGKQVVLMKPSVDDRFGEFKIKSRVVPGMEANIIIHPHTNNFDEIPSNIKYVLVDEAQFLSTVNVNALRKLSERVPVECYGLRTDYRAKLFEGSKRLFEVADSFEEIKTTCVNCEHKAVINAKYHTNKIKNWTVNDVKKWLEDVVNAPADVIQKFIDLQVDGDALLKIKHDDLVKDFNIDAADLASQIVIGLNTLKFTKIRFITKIGTGDPDLGAEDKYMPMCWKCWDTNDDLISMQQWERGR